MSLPRGSFAQSQVVGANCIFMSFDFDFPIRKTAHKIPSTFGGDYKSEGRWKGAGSGPVDAVWKSNLEVVRTFWL